MATDRSRRASTSSTGSRTRATTSTCPTWRPSSAGSRSRSRAALLRDVPPSAPRVGELADARRMGNVTEHRHSGTTDRTNAQPDLLLGDEKCPERGGAGKVRPEVVDAAKGGRGPGRIAMVGEER